MSSEVQFNYSQLPAIVTITNTSDVSVDIPIINYELIDSDIALIYQKVRPNEELKVQVEDSTQLIILEQACEIAGIQFESEVIPTEVDITDENIDSATTTKQLAHYPVVEGSLSGTFAKDTTTGTLTDNGDGTIDYFETGVSTKIVSGTIDYENGSFTVPDSYQELPVDAVFTVSYKYLS